MSFCVAVSPSNRTIPTVEREVEALRGRTAVPPSQIEVLLLIVSSIECVHNARGLRKHGCIYFEAPLWT